MRNPFDNLMVSSPNNGGLFLLIEGEVHKLDGSNTTGLALDASAWARGMQPGTLVTSANGMRSADDGFPDIHDVLLFDDAVYVVATEGNAIVKSDMEGIELQRWVFPGDGDAWHVNCLASMAGRILFSAFGDFRSNREYKGKTLGAGFVQDLESGRRVIDGLSQPHSLLVHGDGLLLTNSETAELQEYDSEFNLLRSINLGGYARGLLVVDGAILVGLSRSRNAEAGTVGTATLLALDLQTWEETARITLPVDEIYSIAVLPKQSALRTLAQLYTTAWARENNASKIYQRASAAHAEAAASAEAAFRAEQSKVADLSREIALLEGDKDRLSAEVLSLSSQIGTAHAAVAGLEAASVERSAAMVAMELAMASLDATRRGLLDRVSQLECLVAEREQREEELRMQRLAVDEERERVRAEQAVSLQRAVELEEMARSCLTWEESSHQLQARLDSAEAELLRLRSSFTWRVMAPVRWAASTTRRMVRGVARPVRAVAFMARNPSFVRVAMAQARREGLKVTLARALQFLRRGEPREPVVAIREVTLDLRRTDGKPVVVLTTHHCMHIARSIKLALANAGIPADIITQQPAEGFSAAPHFVICPQMFECLPGMYVAYQLEQSVSSRWFTRDYFSRLENSFAILEYSMVNVEYLQGQGLSAKQIYFVPIGPADYPAGPDGREPDYDVVFYGDTNNDRRRKYLEKLGEKYRVLVINDLFGPELHDQLRRAHVVVNVHYYAGALLETTRLWECVSLGKTVVSETSVDMDQHAQLGQLVEFVEIDDVDAMVRRVGELLADRQALAICAERNARFLRDNLNEFDYYFHRFLLATDNITFDQFWQLAGSQVRLGGQKLCLNLPEYVDRGRNFSQANPLGFEMFPGLRHRHGWVGCALSYKFMIRLAEKHGFEWVAICEDDAEFGEDAGQKLIGTMDFLTGRPWDVFSGLMADLSPKAEIKDVVLHDGTTFVLTDKMISTVFNLYNASMFSVIAGWNEQNRDVNTNTIDRYIERTRNIGVWTTSPFMVGHKHEEHSTIWSFQNTQYVDLIAASEQLLREKVSDFQARRQDAGGSRKRGT